MSAPIFVPLHVVPTSEQLAVQQARARHVLIEANAGAAKTTSLALRIAQALERGAAPAMVLALTYTAPAVAALRAQLRLIGVPEAAIAALRIHTFESFSAERLETIEGQRPLQLPSLEQVKPYVLRAVERAQTLPEERYPDEFAVATASTALVEGLLRSFEVIKGRLLLELAPPEERMTPELAEDYGFDYLTMRARSTYEFIRRGGNPDRPVFRHVGDATYDLARHVLSDEHDLAASPLALGLGLIVVDEMHDTNRAMFTLIKALLDRNQRAAFVGVGDRDQVIHSQAGAEAGFMREIFELEIARPVRLPLTASHRFGARLAAAVGALARKPYAAAPGSATEIALLHAENHRVMARQIANLAREHLQQHEHDELRILLRQPAHSIPIERHLLDLGLDYATQDVQPFLQRREILLVRGLYAFCSDDFSGFATKARRIEVLDALLLFAGALIESTELRDVDAVTAQRCAVAEGAEKADYMRDFIGGQVLRNAAPPALARLRAALAVLKSGDREVFVETFLAALDPAGLAAGVLVRRDDIAQMRASVAQLVDLVRAENGDLEAAFRMLHELDARQQRMRGNRRLSLSSIEAAKGLEFDHVVVPHLSRGEFVGAASPTENRNLLYVAMTRAKRRLTLAFDPARVSAYLIEAGVVDA